MLESIKNWLSNSSSNSHFQTEESQLEKFQFINFTQIPANNPIEDKLCYSKLKNIEGFTVSVFDGHSGDLLAVFAANNICKYLDQRLKQNKGLLFLKKQEVIKKSLEDAYQDIEINFFNLNKQYLMREQRTIGTCGLTALILKDQIYFANCGDCMGLLLSEQKYARTNKIFNANQQQEQQRLKNGFPEQKNIFTCFGQNLCYLKGILQPTRTLGDYHLKYKNFNFSQIEPWNGPYIQHKPTVTHFQHKNKYNQLVLGSDGLWDQLSDQEVFQIYKKNAKKPNTLSSAIQKQILSIICERNNLSKRQLKQMELGEDKRNTHDDTTIVCINLQLFRQKFF